MTQKKKLYDLPFFSEKLKKIAGQVRDPVIQSELLFVSDSILALAGGNQHLDTEREELQRLLGGESPDWWDPNKEDFT